MIALRDAATEDDAFFLQLYISVRREEFLPLRWDEAMIASLLTVQYRARTDHYRAHYPNGVFQAILQDGEPIGQLITSRGDDEVRIVFIALLPEHQGRGIGASLIRDILKEGARASLPVRLRVERQNRARRFYERLSFRIIGEEDPYLSMEWRPE